MVFFQGRFMAGVACIVLLALAFVTFSLSCSPQGVTGALQSFITGMPAGTQCVQLIPTAIGAIISVVLTTLAGVAVVQVVTG